MGKTVGASRVARAPEQQLGGATSRHRETNITRTDLRQRISKFFRSCLDHPLLGLSRLVKTHVFGGTDLIPDTIS